MRTGWEPLPFLGRWSRSIPGGTASPRSRRAPSCAPPASPVRADLFDAYGEQQLTPALGDERTIAAWIARGARGGAFHLEIDTGMGRSGVRWDEVEPLADLLDTPYLGGCYTQFHSAERSDGSAEAQLERFRLAVGRRAGRQAVPHHRPRDDGSNDGRRG